MRVNSSKSIDPLPSVSNSSNTCYRSIRRNIEEKETRKATASQNCSEANASVVGVGKRSECGWVWVSERDRERGTRTQIDR